MSGEHRLLHGPEGEHYLVNSDCNRKILSTRDKEVREFLTNLLGDIRNVRSVVLRFEIDAPVIVDVERFVETKGCPKLVAEGYELTKKWGPVDDNMRD